MKDARGHGSDPKVAADIDKFAAHQARVESSVPTVSFCKHCGEASTEGQAVYRDLQQRGEDPERSGWDKNELVNYGYG